MHVEAFACSNPREGGGGGFWSPPPQPHQSFTIAIGLEQY